MVAITRKSPVSFKAAPQSTEVRDNWTVVLEYENEEQGPWITDLAHKVRWDLQDENLDSLTVLDGRIPKTPGASILADSRLINRMNRTQASIYHLGVETPARPDFPGYTDVSESTVFLALFGPNVFKIAEKLTNLDFMDPAKEPPFLVQGPFCHVPCQIVTLGRGTDESGGFLMTCSRGYGDSMIEAIMKAGKEYGLHPAGENRLAAWIEHLQHLVGSE